MNLSHVEQGRHPMTAKHDFMPAERDRLEERMRNWARYNVGRESFSPGRCGSAEGRYEPVREDEQRFLRSAQEPIDILDAGRIEDAVVRLKRPSWRRFVVSWYCYRAHPVVMARRFKVPELMLIPQLWGILGAIQYHLDHMPVVSRAQVRYKAQDNLIPATAA